MNSPKLLRTPLDRGLDAHEREDALRIIEAATVIAAIPGLMSPASRDLAARRLRELASAHPRSAEILSAVVQHLESYQ